MIVGLDSATPPTPAQARAAAAAGVPLWSGYLGRPRVGLYRPWTQAEFEAAKLCGSTPIAYCSGWDDPAFCKATAAAWGVRLCLDVEGGIRPDGAWVQAWLTASGAGLYGNAPVHPGRHAPFHVLAAYPGGADPRATWSGVRPPGACGWQWRGTHSEFGVGVDRGWYDDWFAGLHGVGGGDITGGDMTPDQDALQKRNNAILEAMWKGGDAPQSLPVIAQDLAAIAAAIAAIPAGAGGLTAGQSAQLTGLVADVAAIRMRIEKDLAP